MNAVQVNMKPLAYSRKEWLIALVLLPPFALLLNYVLFGNKYFSAWGPFLLASIITTLVIFIVYICCGMVATVMRNQFPKYSQTFKRIFISLLIYVAMMAAAISILFWGYDYIGFLGYEINMVKYFWALIVGSFCNLLATSFNEGAAFFERWREVVDEAEQLKKVNLQSQLEGLKGQVNPHFLFNSLNSLSSLISEDPDKAEKFLDEMSKVYRYMLRNNDDCLVSVEAELQFIHSYFYLLKARYGEGIDLVVDVSKDHRGKFLPPLTLQILLETTISLNKLCKENPLMVEIFSAEGETLQIKNNEQKKISEEESDHGPGIDNVSNKFRLLSQQGIHIVHTDTHRILQVPLMNEEKISIA